MKALAERPAAGDRPAPAERGDREQRRHASEQQQQQQQ
jgi:hypothetical protein